MSSQLKPTQQQAQVQSPLAAQIAARARAQQQASQPTNQVVQSPRPAASLLQIPAAAKPVIIAPSSQPLTSDDIAAWDSAIRQSVHTYRNSLVEIAYYGRRLRAASAWAELGFTDEDHYRANLGLSHSTWTQYLALGERLSHLTLAEMKTLTLDAARLLTRVHPRIWDEYAWVEEASLLPGREFSMLVDQRNREANPTALAEPQTRFAIDVARSQLAPMERRVDTLRKQRSLRSNAAALNYALEAAERERTLSSKLASLESAISDLAKLWQPDAPWSSQLSEPDSERDSRLASGSAPSGLVDAAILSQRLTRKLMKSLEALNAVLPETPDARPPIQPSTHPEV